MVFRSVRMPSQGIPLPLVENLQVSQSQSTTGPKNQFRTGPQWLHSSAVSQFHARDTDKLSLLIRYFISP